MAEESSGGEKGRDGPCWGKILGTDRLYSDPKLFEELTGIEKMKQQIFMVSQCSCIRNAGGLSGASAMSLMTTFSLSETTFSVEAQLQQGLLIS